MYHNYSVFVSSTSDLIKYRKAAREIIDELELRPVMYEDWVSTPNEPVLECLEQIEGSDLYVLIAGASYGTIAANGNSVTENEFDHATIKCKDILAYVIKNDVYEASQKRFVDKINKAKYRGNPITNESDLKIALRRSILQKLIRSDKNITKKPDKDISQFNTTIRIPETHDEATSILNGALNQRLDSEIQAIAGDFEKAFPDDSSILTLLAFAEINLGLNEKEYDRSRIERALSNWHHHGFPIQATEASILYNFGNAYITLNKLDDAEAAFRKALENDPSFAPAWKNLGEVHRQKFNIDKARECYERALSYDPLLFEALYSIASIERSLGKHDEALKTLNRISILSLKDDLKLSVLVRKFQALLKLESYPEAAAVYEDVLKINDKIPGLWEWGAYLFSRLFYEGKPWRDRCIRFWKNFLTHFPKDPNAWYELGRCLYSITEESYIEEAGKEAIHALSQAHNLGFQDDGLIFDYIAHIHEDSGNVKEAERIFRLAIKRSPEKFSHCLGSLLMRQDRFVEAIPYLEVPIGNSDNPALHLTNLAVCYAMTRKYDNAIQLLDQAVKISPDYPRPYYEIGGVLWNSGHEAEAITAWEAAVSRFPNYDRAPEALDMIKFYRQRSLMGPGYEKEGRVTFQKSEDE